MSSNINTTRNAKNNFLPLLLQCNKKRIMDYPNLWGYLRDLYQTPGFGETTKSLHIEHGYQAKINIACIKYCHIIMLLSFPNLDTCVNVQCSITSIGH